MDSQAIEKIEQLVKSSMTVEVEGQQFSVANLKPVRQDIRPNAVTVHNLRGFCGFINNDIDCAIKGKSWLIVVENPKSVTLVSNYNEKDGDRTYLVRAKISEELEEFPFGRFMPQEEFAIKFRSMFIQKNGDDSAYVLAYTSKLVGGTEIQGSDDGITQTVTAKRGVSGALVEKTDLKPIVRLTPWRTFREAEQPESEFLFRVRLENDMPRVALFEADGGAWVNDATQNVVNYIQSMVITIPVIA